MLTTKESFRTVRGLSQSQLNDIKDFLQEKIDSWVCTTRGARFSVRSFLGGENADWGETPMQVLYDRLLPKGHDYAYKQAAKDAGHILKMVVIEDERKFVGIKGRCNSYQLME